MLAIETAWTTWRKLGLHVSLAFFEWANFMSWPFEELQTQNAFNIYIKSKYGDIAFPSASKKGLLVRFVVLCASYRGPLWCAFQWDQWGPNLCLWKCFRLALIPLFASKRQLIVGYFHRLAQVHSGAPEILHVSFDPGWHSVPRSQ